MDEHAFTQPFTDTVVENGWGFIDSFPFGRKEHPILLLTDDPQSAIQNNDQVLGRILVHFQTLRAVLRSLATFGNRLNVLVFCPGLDDTNELKQWSKDNGIDQLAENFSTFAIKNVLASWTNEVDITIFMVGIPRSVEDSAYINKSYVLNALTRPRQLIVVIGNFQTFEPPEAQRNFFAKFLREANKESPVLVMDFYRDLINRLTSDNQQPRFAEQLANLLVDHQGNHLLYNPSQHNENTFNLNIEKWRNVIQGHQAGQQ